MVVQTYKQRRRAARMKPQNAHLGSTPGPFLWYIPGIALCFALAGSLAILVMAGRTGDPPRYEPQPFSALWIIAPYLFLMGVHLGARRSRGRALVVAWASGILIPLGVGLLYDGFFLRPNDTSMWYLWVPLYQAMGCVVAGIMLYVDKIAGRP